MYDIKQMCSYVIKVYDKIINSDLTEKKIIASREMAFYVTVKQYCLFVKNNEY
jgi:hypothetical protein